MRKWIISGAALLALVTAAVSRAHDEGVNMAERWHEASRESAGLAPKPEDEPRAVVQVYGARTWGWRGYFGVHTWISVKPENADTYTVYQVVGWRLRRGHPAVSIERGPPDRRWYGAMPEIYADVRGPEAAAMLERIDEAAQAYPYAHSYTVWPGPNSNTFTAHVARAVPELGLDLPPTAIGKDFLINNALVDKTPSGTGWQASVLGLFGVMLAAEEGLEINILGLVFGLDPGDFALKLPGVGRIGPKGGG
ncbi:MAG: DUF3750 domain-containing protein [Rhodospirillales bacterium]